MSNKKFMDYLNININIEHAEHKVLDTSWKKPTGQSLYTRIYMVTDGMAYLTVDGIDIPMKPGYIYIIPAGLHFSYRCENTMTKTFFHIYLSDKSGYDIFKNASRCFIFYDSAAVKRMTFLVKEASFKGALEIKAYLSKLILKCADELHNGKAPDYSDYVAMIINYIETHVRAYITAEDVAQALLTSTSKLRKAFLEETGIPIGKYISDRVLFRAEMLLCQTSFTIKEISDALGFCDQFYFSRCFTKKYGISPTKYRKLNVKP